MEIKLNLETTFSMSEGSDVFIFLASEEKNEVAYQGLSFDEILDKTFEEITNPEERQELIEKIHNSMRLFLARLAIESVKQ